MDLTTILDQKTMWEYEKYLEEQGVPAKTIKRKLSFLKKKIPPQTYKTGSEDIIITASAKKSAEADLVSPKDRPTDHLFDEGNISQQQSNQRQPESDSHSGINIKNIWFFICHGLLNQKAINNETIVNSKSPGNGTSTPEEMEGTVPSQKLTTEDGKTIRTTKKSAEADLVRLKNLLKKLLFESNLTGNISQQQSNHRYAESNLSQNNSVSQINHNSSNNFSVFTANNQLNIAKMTLAVNANESLVTSIDPNQNITKSEKTDEATFKLAEDIFINPVYHYL